MQVCIDAINIRNSPQIRKGKFHLSSKYFSLLFIEEDIIERIKKNEDRVGMETSKKAKILKYKFPFSFENIFFIKITTFFN